MFDGIKQFFGFGSSGLSSHTGYQRVEPYISSEDLAKPVSTDSALGIAATFACTKLMAETVSSLPLDFFQKDANGYRKPDTSSSIAELLTSGKINRYQTRNEFFETICANLVLHGNSYCKKQYSGSRLVGLMPLNSEQTEPVLQKDGSLVFKFTDELGVHTYTEQDIWHVKLYGSAIKGLSTLGYAAQTMSIGSQANARTAKLLRNAHKRPGILTAGEDLTDEQREQIRKGYQQIASGSGEDLTIFGPSMKFEPIGLSPAEVELQAIKDFSIKEIAMFFRIPPILIGDTAESTSLGSSTTEIINTFYKLSLKPVLSKIEESIKTHLMTASERRKIGLWFNTDDLLRPMMAERADINQKNIQSAIMTPNEIRAKEGMPPIEGGEVLLGNGTLQPVRDLRNQQVQKEYK